MIMSQAGVSPDVFVGDVVNSPYKIETNAKMIGILSSKIYTDKVMAPIRELICNAWDAHVAAGTTDTAIRLDMPTCADDQPKFRIRDYGTGLSEQQMRDLYTTYGASSKTTSNDYTGCLGLGSKSPFAYVPEFTVTSFYGGRRYSFFCSLRDGIASITQFPSLEDDSPAGLMVEFDVKYKDVNTFNDSIRSFLSTFPGLVDVYSGNEKCSICKVDLTDDYGLGVINVKSNYTNVAHGVAVLMCGVLYPYDFTPTAPGCCAGLDITASRFSELRSAFDRYDSLFIVMAEPGDVDFTASREGCESTEKTQQFVLSKLDKYLTEIVAVFMHSLDEDTGLSKFDRAYKVAEFFENNRYLPRANFSQLLDFSFAPTTTDYAGAESSVITMSRKYGGKRHKHVSDKLSESLKINFSAYASPYRYSTFEMFKAVRNGIIRFIRMQEKSKPSTSWFPQPIYYQVDHCSGVVAVVMVYDPVAADYLESVGVPIQRVEDLPKPPRTESTSSSSNKVKSDNKIKDALLRCIPVISATPQSLDPLRISSDSANLRTLTAGYSIVDVDACLDKLAQGELILYTSSRSYDGERAIDFRECQEVSALLKNVSSARVPVRIIDRALQLQGFTSLVVSDRYTGIINTLRRAGALTVAQALKSWYAKNKIMSKNELTRYMVSSVAATHFTVKDLHYPKALSFLPREQRRQLRRYLKTGQSFQPLDEDLSVFWLSALKRFGTGYSYVADGYLNIEQVERVISFDSRIQKQMFERYPMVRVIASWRSKWSEAAEYVEGRADLNQYIEAMELWYEKHKNDKQKGKENE